LERPSHFPDNNFEASDWIIPLRINSSLNTKINQIIHPKFQLLVYNPFSFRTEKKNKVERARTPSKVAVVFRFSELKFQPKSCFDSRLRINNPILVKL